MPKMDGPIELYYRREDIRAFSMAAKVHNLHIVVRRSNPRAKDWIGKNGYQPKLIDCKAKTAHNDLKIGKKDYKTAGLVVNCDVLRPHLKDLFDGELDSVLKEWEKFSKDSARKDGTLKKSKLAPSSIYGSDFKSQRTHYAGEGYTYFTQMDPSHEHYGCIYHNGSTLARSGNYIHGDYDLYACIPADDPGTNVFVQDPLMLGEDHSRSRHLMDVQIALNSLAGVSGLVTHGEQDTFKDNPEDDVDVFHPDGTTTPYHGRDAIRALYRDLFANRATVGAPGAIIENADGLWKQTRW